MGASLLVFKNKSDVAGSMTEDEIREVCLSLLRARRVAQAHPRSHHTNQRQIITGIALRQHSHAQVADHDVQRDDG
jgi:hypothetical protein